MRIKMGFREVTRMVKICGENSEFCFYHPEIDREYGNEYDFNLENQPPMTFRAIDEALSELYSPTEVIELLKTGEWAYPSLNGLTMVKLMRRLGVEVYNTDDALGMLSTHEDIVFRRVLRDYDVGSEAHSVIKLKKCDGEAVVVSHHPDTPLKSYDYWIILSKSAKLDRPLPMEALLDVAESLSVAMRWLVEQ